GRRTRPSSGSSIRRVVRRPTCPAPLVDVVAAGTHLVVPHGFDVEHLRRFAGHGVEPDVAGGAYPAVVPDLRSTGFLHDARHVLAVRGGDVRLEHVGRLADVIVDRDQDQVVARHGAPFAIQRIAAPGPRPGDDSGVGETARSYIAAILLT